MNQTSPTPRRPGPLKRRMTRISLVLVFVVLPIAEIYLLIQIGQVIGAWPTVLLLVADAILGSWLIKRQSLAAFRAVNHMLNQGRMPVRELADGALVVFGGALMLSPGFITDVLGIFLIAPLTRPIARRMLTAFLASRVTFVGPRRQSAGTDSSSSPDAVIVGEVVEDQE
ncbi:hypothetical protein BH09ACT11_BH09ACT11_16030 [soil metagenome]